MSQIHDFTRPALAKGERSREVVAVGEHSAVLALMEAGNDLATALDHGGATERPIGQLVQAWERALFAVARDFDHQSGEGRA